MATDVRNSKAPANPPQPVLVGAAQWLLPGLGYWLLGQRARGVTIGVTILLLFVMGLLIGGVRVLEVPTYGHNGEPLDVPWLQDVRAKPWSVAQVMVGPVGIGAAALSVYASRREPASPAEAAGAILARTGPVRGSESHARTNEIAVLYTAVAGMLNLLAVIDATYRAGKMQEGK
jgi:hypothetical protein